MSSATQGKEFDRIELAAKVFAPPPVKFKDMENFISEHKLLSGPAFPFDVRTDFVKVTESTVLVRSPCRSRTATSLSSPRTVSRRAW